jgi:hypothetical protein
MAKKLAKKQTGGTSPYSKLVGDSIMTKQSKKVHPEKWEPKILAPKEIDTTKVGSIKSAVPSKKAGGQIKFKKKKK